MPAIHPASRGARAKSRLPSSERLPAGERAAHKPSVERGGAPVCPCGGGCPHCQAEHDQREASPKPAELPGQPLRSDLRREFESAFQRDFSTVRVRTDASAAAQATALGANAFTRGSEIGFAAGSYGPDTRVGKHLIAHELAHVAQAPADLRATSPARTSNQGEPLEAEAETAADRALRGESVSVRRHAALANTIARSIACNPKDNEGYPLLWYDPTAPARSWRPAAGYAQERLNEKLGDLKTCHANPACWSALPKLNRDFIDRNLPALDPNPILVDCKFGQQSSLATKIIQAFFFKDPKEWDGKIGPKTWHGIDPAYGAPTPPKPTPPPGPTQPIPNAPVRPPAGPITL